VVGWSLLRMVLVPNDRFGTQFSSLEACFQGRPLDGLGELGPRGGLCIVSGFYIG